MKLIITTQVINFSLFLDNPDLRADEELISLIESKNLDKLDTFLRINHKVHSSTLSVLCMGGNLYSAFGITDLPPGVVYRIVSRYNTGKQWEEIQIFDPADWKSAS